jgi:hypothetical protein
MSKSLLDQRANDPFPLLHRNQPRGGRVDEEVAARDDLVSGDVDKSDRLGVSWFETNGSTSGDVETTEEGEGTVELEGFVDFREVVVGSDLAVAGG